MTTISTDEKLAERRAFFETFGNEPLPAGVTVSATTLGGIPALEIGSASLRTDRALLYLHGGGYVIGSAASVAPLAAALAVRTGTTAYVIDYRLAPEHPLPAAVDDALAAYEDLAGRVDPGAITIAGDSAGGGLAVSLLLAARDRGLPLPAAAAAFSGWFDLTLSGASMRTKEQVDVIFTAEELGWYAGAALGDHDAADPLISSVLADLRGLPPLLLQAGSHEVVLDDSTRLAAAAAAADVEVRLEVYPGLRHVFQRGAAASPPEPDGVRALDSVAAFFAHHLA